MAGRAKLLSVLFFVFAPCLHAQGLIYQLNPPAPNALVQFCPVPDGGYPCPVQTTVYSDSAATQVINQPISVGSSGLLTVYFASGTSSATVQLLGQGYGPRNRSVVSFGGGDPQGGGTSTLPSNLCNGFLIKQGDFLIQNSTGNAGGATFTLTWRMILTTGERKEFQQASLGASAGNGPAYNSFPLVEGCLVGGSLTLLGGTIDAGQVYSQVFFGKNFSPIPNASAIQLIGCSFGSNYSVGWVGTAPGSCRPSTDGQGFNQTITFANPAAATNLVNGALSGGSIVGQKHWLANVRFTLTTGAGATPRQACITFKDGSGNIVYGNCIQGTQAATLIVNYDFTSGVGAQYPGAATLIAIPSTNVAATANEVQSTLPSNFQFSDASTISITIIGITGTDQLSNIVVRTFWSHHVTD